MLSILTRSTHSASVHICRRTSYYYTARSRPLRGTARRGFSALCLHRSNCEPRTSILGMCPLNKPAHVTECAYQAGARLGGWSASWMISAGCSATASSLHRSRAWRRWCQSVQAGVPRRECRRGRRLARRARASCVGARERSRRSPARGLHSSRAGAVCVQSRWRIRPRRLVTQREDSGWRRSADRCCSCIAPRLPLPAAPQGWQRSTAELFSHLPKSHPCLACEKAIRMMRALRSAREPRAAASRSASSPARRRRGRHRRA